MKPEIRTKKNNNYKKNLDRRFNLTKKWDYLEQISDGIFKPENYKNPMDGKYEFVTTRNKSGNVVTRYMYTYKWTAQAKAVQKLYHDTKNGIEPKEIKPKELFFNVDRTKEEIKEYFAKKMQKRKLLQKIVKFSKFHYDLIDNLYMNNKYIQIIKNTEATAQHEQKIKDLMYKLMISKANKPSYKLFKKTKKANNSHLPPLNIAA